MEEIVNELLAAQNDDTLAQIGPLTCVARMIYGQCEPYATAIAVETNRRWKQEYKRGIRRPPAPVVKEIVT